MHRPDDNYTCDLCGNSRFKKIWTLEFPSRPVPFHLWRCRECGVVFNWPQLSDEDTHRQYGPDYYVYSKSPAHCWARATQVYINNLLPLERERTGRRLLEIGCARGHLLALARHRGWRVQGVEVSAEPARWAETQLGVPVQVGSLTECSGRLGTFDVAIAVDVIEHVQSPRRFMLAIRRSLNASGQVVIDTPNWGGLWRHVGGRKWIGLNRFHLFLFDARCLVPLMLRCGFGDCVARSSTNTTHANWGGRPELTRIIGHLPRALGWRVERLLDRATPRSLAVDLRWDPPASLDQALERIETCSIRGNERTTSIGLSGDNLTVVGRAVGCQQTCRPRRVEANLDRGVRAAGRLAVCI